MADDIYVEVGPRAVKSGKVPKEYAGSAKKLMRNGAIKGLKKAAGYTAEKKGKPTKGFYIDAALIEIAISEAKGKESVFCTVTGVVATWPKRMMLTSKLTSKTGFKGASSKKDVEDCMSLVMELAIKDEIVPFLKKQKV